MAGSKLFRSASAAALLGGLLGPGAAWAQAADATVDEVVVTGSFIQGTSERGALPVDVVGAEELARRGAPSMVQLIKTIPSSGAVIGENNRFGGGSGAATINLRNLNSPSSGARTLVLFNGRRLPASAQAIGSVDINLLPAAAIGRVEVLKDGAAATYGSDAIGGVVNFITRRDLEGFEVNAQYQAVSGSAGDYEGSVAWGHKGERLDVLLTAGYRHRSELSIGDRDWALRPGLAGYLENPLGGWSNRGNPGLYQYAAAPPAGSPDTGYSAATFAAPLLDIGCLSSGGNPYYLTTTIVNPAGCNFQYTNYDNLIENEDHYQVYGQVGFDLTDRVHAYGEVLYAAHDTPNQSWPISAPNQFPTPLLASGGSAGGGVSPVPATGANEQSRFYIPATNPGLVALLGQISSAKCNGTALPYGLDAASCASGLALAQAGLTSAGQHGVAASQTDWGPIGIAGVPYTSDRHAHFQYKVETFRVVGGLKGQLAGGVRWDASATFQEQAYDYAQEDVSVNRLQLALRGYGSRAGASDACTAAETANFTTNAGNAALGCFYFNPFNNAVAQSLAAVPPNPYYIASSAIPGFNDAAANRAAVYDWMDEQLRNQIKTRLFVADLVLNGQTEVELPGGALAWAAGAQFRYDRTQQSPDAIYDATLTPCVDSPPFGSGASACPATSNGAFLFNASIRPYEVERRIWSGFVEVNAPLLDTLDLTLAGRYETYEGQGSTFNPKASLKWSPTDWLALRGSIGTTYRAPAATLTEPSFVRGISVANGNYRANDLYGNPGLDPEKALTYSVGAIVNVGRFSATLDYWNFDFEDGLTAESPNDLLAIMFPGGSATGNCGAAAYAAIQSRFQFVGACGRANILSYRTRYINGGKISTDGVDFQAELDLGEVLGGQLTTGFDGSYLLSYDEAPYQIEGFVSNAAGVQKRAGTYRASIFTGYNRLRANGFLNWASGDQNLRAQLRYVSSVNQVEPNPINIAAAVKSTAKIAEYWQLDLTYRVELPWTTTATLGVQNVFDNEPSFAIGTQYNYDPSSGTPLGRVFSLGLRKRF